MKPIFSFLVLFFVVETTAQTHFTIPQNVWRITIKTDYSSGNWKTNNLQNTTMKHYYPIYTKVYSLNQYYKRTTATNKIDFEYGFTDRATLVFQIPYINKITEESSWSLLNDSSSVILDSLFNFYYPPTIINSGLSDLTIGMNILLKGSPAWRGGKQKFSLYSGLEMKFPFAERLKKYDPDDKGSDGIPNQFKQVPLGDGLTEIKLKFFGEFYRKKWGRLFNINWKVGVSSFQKSQVNPRITFLWIQNASADSIANSIGNVIQKKPLKLSGMMSAQIELVPKKVFFTTGADWTFSGREKFFSSSSEWSEWMTKHKGYDSRFMYSSQFVKANLFNLDPYFMVGPVPFELEIGARWFLPYPFTFNTYGNISSWLQISTYLQAW